MNKAYLPTDTPGKMWHVSEECGEVLKNLGKAGRFGLDNYDPTVPKEKRETNREAILRELEDLVLAAGRLKEALI